MAKTYSIGRRLECDIVLSHPSISREHADLVVNDGANVTLIDRDSKFGTFILQPKGEWLQIKSSVIAREDQIRLGRYETSGRDLLARIPRVARASEPSEPIQRVEGALERNPETGEIVPRRSR